MIIASCGHKVEDIDDTNAMYQLYFDIGFNGETVGVICGEYCNECFNRYILEGDGFRTEQEVWDVIEKNVEDYIK